MSLLEDVFLQDEANEAQELERIIEGGDYEERNRSDSDDNNEKEDEAEEDKRHVDPSTKSKRVIKNPRFILNPARLTGPRGIHVIPEHFKDFKFKGKGHEKEDLDLVLKKLEHWAYRLYPKFKFEDCLKKIEVLGKKRPVMVNLHKIRSDQFTSEETVVQQDSSDDEIPQEDEFDKLLQQQIDLARSTPAKTPGSLDSPRIENRTLLMPKATSLPSISDEQRDRMLRSRKLAEERRLAKLKNINDRETPELALVNNSSDNMADGSNKGVAVDLHEQSENTSINSREKSNNVSEGGDVDINEINVKDNSDEKSNIDNNNIDNPESNSVTSVFESTSDDNNVRHSVNVNDNLDCYQRRASNEENNKSIEKVSIDLLGNKDVEIEGHRSDQNVPDNRISPNEGVIENSIIQSTIQGLVENDNNLNHERDLINQDLDVAVVDGVGVDDDLMDVDFSEQF